MVWWKGQHFTAVKKQYVKGSKDGGIGVTVTFYRGNFEWMVLHIECPSPFHLDCLDRGLLPLSLGSWGLCPALD